MTATLSINGQSLRDAFQAWHAERDAIDSQLSESLAALTAYQSHLDDWQQRLVRERDELAAAREQFEQSRGEFAASNEAIGREREAIQAAQQELDQGREQLQAARESLDRDRNELDAARQQFEQERDQLRGERSQLEHNQAAVDAGHSEESAAVTAELNAAHDKISELTASLLNHTEELRTLDQRRSEAAAETDLARAREVELQAALDEQKRAADQERARWQEELRQLRELLDRRADTSDAVERVAPAEEQPLAPSEASPATGGAPAPPRQTPVLSSIVQQFDKLRQQRASDRHAANKPR